MEGEGSGRTKETGLRRAVPTGIEGLDTILNGGLLSPGIYVVSGATGTGKTTLALHFAVNMAFSGHNVLYVTLEEGKEEIKANAPPGLRSRLARFSSHSRVLLSEGTRDGAGVGSARAGGVDEKGWDEKGVRTGRLYFLDFSSIREFYGLWGSRGLRGKESGGDVWLSSVAEVVQRRKEESDVSVCVLDGVSALAQMYPRDSLFREDFFRLARKVKSLGVLCLMTAESSQGGRWVDVERYVSDGVFHLSFESEGRYLSVLKTRGRGFISGWHEMEIDRDGVKVYPSVFLKGGGAGKGMGAVMGAGGGNGGERTGPIRFESFGVRGLDEMVGGGLLPGEIIFVSGSPGTGKTLLGLHYVAEVARTGGRGIYISFKESASRLGNVGDRYVGLFSRGLRDGKISIRSLSVFSLSPMKHLHEIKRLTEGVDRVVFDAVSDYRKMLGRRSHDPDFYTFMEMLISILRENGCGALFISDSPEIMGSSLGGELPVMYMVDTGIVLRHMELASEMKKVIMVLKRKGFEHSVEIKELGIDRGRITVGEKFRGVEGILTGRASVLEERIEKFFG